MRKESHKKSNCTIRNNVKTDLTHKKKINRLFESFQPLNLSPEKEKKDGNPNNFFFIFIVRIDLILRIIPIQHLNLI